ncbi:hypothetical protein [Stratiformator vulcanicus]|uniref:Uncharacterized protein n=1 Tax=Stratiformator vulcanicus TaxID=2527980 RepID=A0A517R472_9PLAN|nr:hypothetical protein [Stratiformator vulcanicus]QDT38678.1 hypothetical protein Pan189_30740 [Stratiformator vulcanicus]
MSTAIETCEVDEFIAFIQNVVGDRRKQSTPEKCVKAFRRYQEMKIELDEAAERLDRGEGIPWDPEKFKAEARKRLAEKGIFD